MGDAIDPEAVRLAFVAKFRDTENGTRAQQKQANMKTTMAFWGLCKVLEKREPILL